ncbi:MAG: DUF5667 domain-containing protein, partial [Dehalococcoidales bacterium]|nr:DUF5667 domain-containing protein [Dehalococcoidales bacterium]
MNNEFNDILNECIERLLLTGETVEQCLEHYPEQADNLKPLLQTVITTRDKITIQPRIEFKARARYQFHSVIQELSSKSKRSFLSWFPQWATALIIVLGVLMMGGGTVVAASYSMPDSFLYPLKLATEQVQLALNPSDNAKVKLHVEFADRRVAEIIYTANTGNAQQIDAVTERLDGRLAMLVQFTSDPEELEETEAPRMLESATPSSLQIDEAASNQKTNDNKNGHAKLKKTVTDYATNHPAALEAALKD